MDKRQPAGDGLRTSAELRLGRRTASNVAARDLPADVLVHELQVHQIELELQNAELRQAQQRFEESRDCYLDLYDLAPVGYLTLNSVGVIVEANLSGVEMFGFARNSLLNRRFASLISPSERNHWHGLFKDGGKLRTALGLKNCKGSTLHGGINELFSAGAGMGSEIMTWLPALAAAKQARTRTCSSRRPPQADAGCWWWTMSPM